MDKTKKASKTVAKGAEQSAPEATIKMVALQVSTYNFRKMKQASTLEVILTPDVETFIDLGFLTPVAFFDKPESEVDVVKSTLDYQTKCQGCGG